MELYLIHEDLWDCVVSHEDEAGGSPETRTPEDRRKDQRARAKICLMIQPHCLIHVRNAKTARETWNNLQNAFENKGLTRRLSLLRRLFSVKLENYKNIETYYRDYAFITTTC